MFGFCKRDPNIPIEHLDYKYIETCTDVKKLQNILEILRSGEEGRYPSLEEFTEGVIARLDPDNVLLTKTNKETHIKDLPSQEKDEIFKEIQNFTKDKTATVEGQGELPVVRPTKNINTNKTKAEKKRNVAPRSYDEWSKIEKDIDKGEKKQTLKKLPSKEELLQKLKNKPAFSSNTGSEEESQRLAEGEKLKGNEAFRCGDYTEALAYYDRALSIRTTPAVQNNRAIVYIKLKRYAEALTDCNAVLKQEPDNLKGYLRRGISNDALGRLSEAKTDFERVIKGEPNNKRAKELLNEVKQKLEKSKKSNEKINNKNIGKEKITTETTQKSNNKKVVEVEKSASENTEKPKNSSEKKGKRLVVEEINTSDTENVENQKNDVTKPLNKPKQSSKLKIEEINSAESEQNSKKNANESASGSVEQNQKPEPVTQKEMPAKVLAVKDEGNGFFKAGNYAEASQKYTSAIKMLEKDNTSGCYSNGLATLLSNRAMCHMRLGSCRECVDDCNASIDQLPTAKAFLRRAVAYETMEKYLDAYADYQVALSFDRSTQAALQATSRLLRILKDEHGSTWRDRLPKRPNYNALVNTLLTPSQPNQNQLTYVEKKQIGYEEKKQIGYEVKKQLGYEEKKQLGYEEKKQLGYEEKKKIGYEEKKQIEGKSDKSGKKSSSASDKKEHGKKADKQKGPETVFNETKTCGNKAFQKGNYVEAIQCYTKCLLLRPEEVTCYTNRAICYIKSEKEFDKAIQDCTRALGLQPNNVKALFRRGLAYKATRKYKEALTDFTNLLKVESTNSAAKNELETCKELFRKELREMQATTAQQKERKGKKIKIEEVASEPVKGEPSTKTNGIRSNNTKATSSQKAQQNPPNSKMSGFEFLQAWSNSRGNAQELANLLSKVDPLKLPDLLSNKLDGELLQTFIQTVNQHYTSKENFKSGIALLKNLSRCSRFITMLLFLSTADKSLLKTTIDTMETRSKQHGDETTKQGVQTLRSAYRC